MTSLIQPWIKGHAWCAILDPSEDNTQYDQWGMPVQNSRAPIWTGWMRVQPLRTDITVKRAVDSTTQRTVQFWPEGMSVDGLIGTSGERIDAKPGLEIVVVQCDNNPDLTNYQYITIGGINSDLAWNKTIIAVTNQESRPVYDTTYWPQPTEVA